MNTKGLSGKVVCITGAAGGIGSGIAREANAFRHGEYGCGRLEHRVGGQIRYRTGSLPFR